MTRFGPIMQPKALSTGILAGWLLLARTAVAHRIPGYGITPARALSINAGLDAIFRTRTRQREFIFGIWRLSAARTLSRMISTIQPVEFIIWPRKGHVR